MNYVINLLQFVMIVLQVINIINIIKKNTITMHPFFQRTTNSRKRERVFIQNLIDPPRGASAYVTRYHIQELFPPQRTRVSKFKSTNKWTGTDRSSSEKETIRCAQLADEAGTRAARELGPALAALISARQVYSSSGVATRPRHSYGGQPWVPPPNFGYPTNTATPEAFSSRHGDN